jgi:serine/threonine protein kinase/WD40 repeat protein
MSVDAAAVERIFNEAVERPTADDRAAYLDAACGADRALRDRVESLLAAHLAATAVLPLPSSRDLTGQTIGPYKLLQLIGEGGFAVVYMAEQEHPVRRRVALKVIKLGMDTKQVVARFEAERQALAMMDHPSIAKVFDAGSTESGRPYFVMELVKGTPITEYCDKHNLNIRQRLELCAQVCQAVQHAHQKGLIHRDIKPSNVLVATADDRPLAKVIDFGIAKATLTPLTLKTLFTDFQQLIGTPTYMSPEQAEGSLDIDTRTDVYSLGVLLYELLTGTTPFDTKELATAGLEAMRRMIREREPPRPSTRVSAMIDARLLDTATHRAIAGQKLIHLLRGDLDWVVMKCLEKDRRRRYETASALAGDLERHLADQTVVARQPSWFYQLQKLARRNRTALALASMAALTIAVALISLAISVVRITKERNQKSAALIDRGIALDSARQSERSAKQLLFLSLRSQAEARRFSHQMGQRLGSLEALQEAARIRPGEDDLGDQAIAAMALADIRSIPMAHRFADDRTMVAVDSDCRYCAQLDAAAGILSVHAIADDRQVARINAQRVQLPQMLLFSPDSRFVVLLDDPGARLRAWRISDGKEVFSDPPKGCFAIAFSSDGATLATGQTRTEVTTPAANAAEHAVALFDLASGRQTHSFPLNTRPHALAFDPHDARLAVGYFDVAPVSILDAATGKLLAQLPYGSSDEEVIAWHPDGKRLAIAGSDAFVQIWDVDDLKRLALISGHTQAVVGLAFHPDGALLASTSWEGIVRVWETTSGRQLLQAPLVTLTPLRFSKDGRWLGAAWLHNQQLQLLQVESPVEYRTLSSAHSTGPYEGDISPDGQILAVGMNYGVHLWDLPSARELAFLPLGYCGSAFFRAGSSELVTCGPEHGLERWPLRRHPADSARLLLGPRNRMELPYSPMHASFSRDQDIAAVFSEGNDRAVLLGLGVDALDSKQFPHRDFTHPSGGLIAISPDANWLATAGWHSTQALLWSLHSGVMAHEWAVPTESTRVFFTPDSRELILSGADVVSFWDVNTCQQTRQIQRDVSQYPSYVAFSPDRKMMAIEMAPGIVHLKDARSMRTIAKLQDPSFDRAAWMTFSPDGTQLVVAAIYAKLIHVWDLRAIRDRLTSMGLDGGWPAFAPAPTSQPARQPFSDPPFKIEVLEKRE